MIMTWGVKWGETHHFRKQPYIIHNIHLQSTTMDIPVIFKFLPLHLRLIAIKIDRWLAINWMMVGTKSLHRKWFDITKVVVDPPIWKIWTNLDHFPKYGWTCKMFETTTQKWLEITMFHSFWTNVGFQVIFFWGTSRRLWQQMGWNWPCHQ